MSTETHSHTTGDLATAIQGVWWLLSREDYTKDGQHRIDPILGQDPLGILTYARTHFAAQFMKRDRTNNDTTQVVHSGQNNTIAVGGYDAYFGTYKVDEETGRVAHTLLGSITPSNIGITVLRELEVIGNQLTIRLDTTTPGAEPVTRTLTWKKIS